MCDISVWDIIKMRWTTVYWVIVYFGILAASNELTRHKRSLSFLKRFLLSNIVGSKQKQCAETSAYRKPSQGYEIFVVPAQQKVLFGAVREKTRQPKNSNNNRYFSNLFRQFLTSDIIRETSEVFRGVINALQSESSTLQEANRVIEDVSVHHIQGSSQDLFEENETATTLPTTKTTTTSTSIPVIEFETPTLTNEVIYRRLQMPTNLIAVVRFLSPMIEMPRKYSYEQINDQTVRTFTLDKNSDVIVTETKKRVPHPAYIHDRIKDVTKVICSNDVKNQFQKAPNFSVQDYVRNKMKTNDRNGDSTSSINHNESGKLQNYDKLSNLNQNIVMKPSQDVFDQSIDQSWNFSRSNDITSGRTPNEVDFEAPKFKSEYVYVPPITVEESSPNVLNEDIVAVDTANIQTRYMYKQQTENGMLNYSDESTGTFDQQTEKSASNPSDNLYTGKPIIVTPLNGPSMNTSSYPLSQVTDIYENVKDELRGDIR